MQVSKVVVALLPLLTLWITAVIVFARSLEPVGVVVEEKVVPESFVPLQTEEEEQKEEEL